MSIAREADPTTGGAKDAEPFSVGAFRFEYGCGLYFIAAFDSRLIMESVTRLMNLLGAEGIGGKISAGFGKFRLAEGVTLDGSEPACLQPLAKMLREKSASHYILLTSSLPTDDELPAAMENAQYTLIRRAGFVQSDRIFNPRKKRTQYFFAAGSVFGRKFDGDLYDVSENMPHPVYRYAKPIFLGGERMIKTGHLETYDVILTVRTPLHIGSGHVINKQEYAYDPRTKTVRIIDMARFLAMLAEKQLASEYENLIIRGTYKDGLSEFLEANSFTPSEIDQLTLYQCSVKGIFEESVGQTDRYGRKPKEPQNDIDQFIPV